MFGKSKEKNTEKQKNTDQEAKNMAKLSVSDIRVMPEKYRGAKEVSSRSTGKKQWIIIISLIVVLVVLVSGAIVFFTSNLEDTQTEMAGNVNLNANVPVNTNVNSNVNANVPAEEEEETVNANVPVEEEEVEPEEEEVEIPAVIPPSSDLDNDGLTDTEEALFNTDINNEDTDGDNYNDGLEVRNLYNPAGTAPIRIAESGLVETYNNMEFGYSIIYPADWIRRSIDNTSREVIFSSATGEFVQVIIEENPSRLTALGWYMQEFPSIGQNQISEEEMEFFEGVRSPDESTVYLTYGDREYIYVISYNTGVREEANFKTTFEMMLESFSLSPENR